MNQTAKATTATETTKRRAMWIGGPPGATLARLREKLDADGIVVDVVAADLFAGQRIPKHVDLVLLNSDMTSHNESHHARDAAKAAGVQLVQVRTNYSTTRLNLIAAGVVAEKAPAMVLDASISAPTVPVADVSFDDVERYIRALPADVRAWAAICCASIDEEEKAKAADDAVARAFDELGNVPAAALMAAIRRRTITAGRAGHHDPVVAAIVEASR